MKNLALLRKEFGLSQQKLGNEIGLARNTICQYESGNRVPDVDTLKKIADYFDVSIDYLLGREEKKYTKNCSNNINVSNMRLLRKEQNITLDKVATDLNSSSQVISRYERGERMPDQETLLALADYYNVSLDYLLGRTDVRNNIAQPANALTERERTLLDIYRNIQPINQTKLLAYAEGLQSADKPANFNRY